MNERTKVFILSNEKSSETGVSPYRCSYCGELAKIDSDAQEVYCDCEDASIEDTLKKEISDLDALITSKSNELNAHVSSKVFDSDTRMMRYEDELTSLRKKYGI